MLKNAFFFILITGFMIICCRNNEEDTPLIDQITHIYIDSAGKDMLNNKLAGSYTTVSLNDLYASVDVAPVSFVIRKDSDTLNYMEYIAGAKRKLIDSTDINNKMYQSKIAFNMTFKDNSQNIIKVKDTLEINYRYTPTVFEIHSAFYNHIQVFSKISGKPNIIKIVK